MSYIRPLQPRKYSKGEPGLYAFLSTSPEGEDDFIEDYGAMKHPENYVEITCRILQQADINLTLDEVNQIRERVGLEPLDKIPSKQELEKQKQQIIKENKAKIEQTDAVTKNENRKPMFRMEELKNSPDANIWQKIKNLF